MADGLLCGRPNNFCLMHTPNGRDGEAERNVWKEAELMLDGKSRLWSTSDRGLDFTGFNFPNVGGMSTIFAGKRFEQALHFERAVFEGDVSFKQSQFPKAVGFRRTVLRGLADFSEAVFDQHVDFLNGELNRWLATYTKFAAGADFAGSQFHGHCELNRASFGGLANFLNTQWQGTVSFFEASFQTANFLKSL